MKGHLAKRYSDLTQDLWSGSNKTVAPLKVRVSSDFLECGQIATFVDDKLSR